MTIRNKALKWYNAKYGRTDPSIYTSKFYQPDESWPKKSVWWPQIPMNAINDSSTHVIHILCQIESNRDEFHHLKVPTKFLREHIEKFHTIKGQISLYLSTEPERLFIEERGEGNLNFQNFLVT